MIKNINDMKGSEKAAMLMVALGSDVAAEIFRHLDDDVISKLSVEIAKIDKLTVEDKEELIGEFLIEYRKNKGSVSGGQEIAKSLLQAAFGEKKTDEILGKLSRKDLEKGFEFLKTIDSAALASLLQNEHPQTITVTLSYLPSNKSAEILKLLPTGTAKEIVKRMARLDKTSPDAVLEIARVIKNKYEKSKTGIHQETPGGVNVLVDIMSQMSLEQEEKLMDFFDTSLPELSEDIRGRIFTFENVLLLTHQEIRILIDEIGNDIIIAKALKGAGDEIRFIFLRNMSQNRATDIINEMQAIGPLRLTEIKEARSYIVSLMRSLNDNNIISIRKDREQYVE